MLKKVISVLVAAAMFMTVSVTAFAASVTVKSGDGSVTLHEVTSKVTETTRINKKTETVTIYYCPRGSKVTIEPDSSDTAQFGSTRCYQTIDEKGMYWYTKVRFQSGTDFAVDYSRYGFETYFANDTGPIVYVMPDSFAPSTATPVKSNINISETVTPKEKPVQDTETATQEVEKALQEAAKALQEAANATAEPPALTRSDSDIIHTVKKGDTFSVMALNYFGDMMCWSAIYNYNADAINATKNKRIFEGMEIAIPTAVQHGEKTIDVIAPCVAEIGEKLYTVKSGETLEAIALAQYNDASKGEAILERNADRLTTNTLNAGQIIVLPAQ